MPKFIIGRSYGYAGTTDEYEVECDTLKEAEDWANEWALENVESWAKPILESEE